MTKLNEKDKAIRLMKEALFACIKAGLTEAKYGGVAVESGGKAWITIEIRKDEPAPDDPIDAEMQACLAEVKGGPDAVQFFRANPKHMAELIGWLKSKRVVK